MPILIQKIFKDKIALTHSKINVLFLRYTRILKTFQDISGVGGKGEQIVAKRVTHMTSFTLFTKREILLPKFAPSKF